MRQKLLGQARRLIAQARHTMLRFRLGERWDEAGDAFGQRRYPSYQDYLAHQATKYDALRATSITRHDRRFFEALSTRLATLPLRRRNVLCLAARQGTEVRAFIAQGAFAVGIDLNPGRANPHVLPGDFHNIQFASDTVDVVYTNSLDHAFDPERLFAEVRRVLAPDGLFIAEVRPGATDRSQGRGFYESFSWASLDELVRRIEATGFRLEDQASFLLPWPGEQLRFRTT